MPSLSPTEIVRSILNAIKASGAQGSLLSRLVAHPRVFQVVTPIGDLRIWVYIWTITHGGATRSEEEYRIQMTTVASPLLFNPEGPTLLLGWYPNLGVFAGFDIVGHRKFTPGSNSVQVSLSALRAASNFGWGFYQNQYGEITVTFRPGEFLNYTQNAESLHRNGVGAVDLLTKAAKLELVDPAELEELPATRKRIVQTISRYARAANFRDQVLSAYSSRCAVTGIQLSLVDAAHILPVGASGSTDTVANGICLSPTYHRAFDSGLIYLSTDYKMILNITKFEQLRSIDLDKGIDQVRRHLGREIFLPANPSQRPSSFFIRRANAYRKIPAVNAMIP